MFNSLIPFSRNNNLDTIFNRFFDDSFNYPNIPSDIKVDIRDNDTEYLVEAEIPGVTKDQIKVDYQSNYLTIDVQSQNEVKEEDKNYIRRERSSRRMSRSFYFENIKDEAITANYENGILKIKMPKGKEISAKKTIEIK